MRAALDRMAKAAARRLLAWVAQRVDPTRQTWLEALRAELDMIDGGIAQLMWAVGGLRLIWFDRRRHMVNATYRHGPVLLPGLEAALFVGLTWSLIQHYGSLVIILLELAGLGLVVAVPVLIALAHVIRSCVPTRLGARHLDPRPERRVRPLLPLVLAVLSLGTLLVLLLGRAFSHGYRPEPGSSHTRGSEWTLEQEERMNLGEILPTLSPLPSFM